MPRECPNCEKPFRTRTCPICGWSPVSAVKPSQVARETRPLHEIYPPPASDEEARAAIKGILAMLSGNMTVGAPRRRVEEPEVDDQF